MIGLVGNMASLCTPLPSIHFHDNEGNDVTPRVLEVIGKEFPEGGIISVVDVFQEHGSGPQGEEDKNA